MNYDYIIHEHIGSVSKIILNRPEVLNSFNKQMAEELQDALIYCTKSDKVRAVLLTGNGKAFSAGQDLSEIKDHTTDMGEIVRHNYNPVIRLIRNIEKPVICAVNGVAAGAGANIALSCDIVYAAHSASFVQAFVNIGLVPDSGASCLLPRLAGLPRATAQMMLGEKITAENAYEFGMIYKVIELELLNEETEKAAQKISQMPTLSIGLTKRAINKAMGGVLDSQLDYEADLQSIAGNSEDFKEGLSAFLEKRKPNYIGK